MLERLDETLSAPHWVLYAGRKACALGLPPDPTILSGEGPLAALEAYGWPWTRRMTFSRKIFSAPAAFSWAI